MEYAEIWHMYSLVLYTYSKSSNIYHIGPQEGNKIRLTELPPVHETQGEKEITSTSNSSKWIGEIQEHILKSSLVDSLNFWLL